MRDVIPLADRVAFSELNRGKRAAVITARAWGLAAGEATNVVQTRLVTRPNVRYVCS